jgi:protein phosphatase
LPQPDLKCRGRDYLKITYGPQYTLAENTQRLRTRNLGSKRTLVPRANSLPVSRLWSALPSGMARPRMRLWVLAPESEPVDPRL